MSEQVLIGIARDLIDAFNAKGGVRFKKQLSDNVVYDEVGTQRNFQSADASVQVWEQWRNAFPDLKGTITNAVASRTPWCRRSLGRERKVALLLYRMAQSPRLESARSGGLR